MRSPAVEMSHACSFPAAYQSLTFLSFDPEIIVLQSVVMETQDIQDECPISVCWHSPVAGFQTLRETKKNVSHFTCEFLMNETVGLLS